MHDGGIHLVIVTEFSLSTYNLVGILSNTESLQQFNTATGALIQGSITFRVCDRLTNGEHLGRTIVDGIELSDGSSKSFVVGQLVKIVEQLPVGLCLEILRISKVSPLRSTVILVGSSLHLSKLIGSLELLLLIGLAIILLSSYLTDNVDGSLDSLVVVIASGAVVSHCQTQGVEVSGSIRELRRSSVASLLIRILLDSIVQSGEVSTSIALGRVVVTNARSLLQSLVQQSSLHSTDGVGNVTHLHSSDSQVTPVASRELTRSVLLTENPLQNITSVSRCDKVLLELVGTTRVIVCITFCLDNLFHIDIIFSICDLELHPTVTLALPLGYAKANSITLSFL